MTRKLWKRIRDLITEKEWDEVIKYTKLCYPELISIGYRKEYGKRISKEQDEWLSGNRKFKDIDFSGGCRFSRKYVLKQLKNKTSIGVMIALHYLLFDESLDDPNVILI